MILLLSLSVPGYACFPDTVDGWAAWCEDNGISYEVGTSADALEFYYSSDLFDRELPTLEVTVPPIYEPPYVSPYGQSVPYEPPTWTPYDPTTTDPDPDPKDCAGVEGGSAYLDNCQECVGGTTGKEACDFCEEMTDELANLTSENSTLMAVKQKSPSDISNGPCAPAGFIYRNGQIVNWNSIATSSMDLVSVSKYEYNHFDGINMLIDRRDMYNKASNFGVGALSIPLINLGSGKIAEFLTKNLTKIMTKGCTAAMALAASLYSTDMTLKSDFYSKIHDRLSQMSSDVGLYEIRTERTTISSTGNNHSTHVEIYDTNGCLVDDMTFN